MGMKKLRHAFFFFIFTIEEAKKVRTEKYNREQKQEETLESRTQWGEGFPSSQSHANMFQKGKYAEWRITFWVMEVL